MAALGRLAHQLAGGTLNPAPECARGAAASLHLAAHGRLVHLTSGNFHPPHKDV